MVPKKNSPNSRNQQGQTPCKSFTLAQVGRNIEAFISKTWTQGESLPPRTSLPDVFAQKMVELSKSYTIRRGKRHLQLLFSWSYNGKSSSPNSVMLSFYGNSPSFSCGRENKLQVGNNAKGGWHALILLHCQDCTVVYINNWPNMPVCYGYCVFSPCWLSLEHFGYI